jgi:hypothetical protein
MKANYDDYYELTPKGEKWFKGREDKMRIEEAIYLYLKWKYPEHSFIKINPYNLNTKRALSCDLIWQGMEDYTNLFKHIVVYPRKGTHEERMEKHKGIWEGLMNLPNIFPPKEYTEYNTNKCNYYAFARKLGINVVPTNCMDIKTVTLKKFLNFANKFDSVYVKPMPSGEGHGNASFKKPYNKTEIQEYIKYAGKEGFHTLVVQEYATNWPTERNPELRTVWVGHKYQYGIRTKKMGEVTGMIKRLPKIIREGSLLLISKLEKKFNVPNITVRIDWGKTPDGKYFLNEFETMFGTFIDYFGNPGLEVEIGERIIEVTKEMILRKKTSSKKTSKKKTSSK